MINMQQLSQMLLALFIGLLGSILFIFLHLPLPWLLGAIFTTSIAMRFENLPIQSPRIFSAPARILIGLIIGSAFTPEILEFLHIYLFSILLIIPYSIIVTFAGMYYYVRFLRFDRKTAFFSSTPGGVVEMVILGEEQKADTSKITLVQSSRLLFVVLTLPFIIQYIFHLDISGNQLITKALKDTNLTEFFYLIILGTFGALLAKKLRMSAAFLIGPMILSVIAYSGGFVHTLIPDELIKFVQVIFGTIIGFTFKGVKLRMIIKTLMGTFGHFVIIGLISSFFVFIAYYFFDFPVVSILLAFSPGGQTEMNLIALIVGANVPYITIHHIMRLFIVMNLAPIVAKRL
ncbi:MAG: AbrB family transcriptional regulator [Aliarcobacter sp.]|nr:AbrB family transcriptional regulator [Aliarcobacter sp.]